MARPLGGYIGFNRVPAASAINSAAVGVWTLREAEALKRAGTWPSAGNVVTSISGLQLWLDAAAPETLFDATTGGSLVAADGAVARWEDKSGNARHFTQPTSGNRPTRKTAQQNGLGSLLFDGTNDSLIGSNFASGTAGLSILCVLKRNATGANHEIINKGVDNGGWILQFASGNGLAFSSYRDATLGNSTIRQSSSSVSASGYTLVAMTAGSGAFNTASMFRNGSAIGMAEATEAGTNGRTPSSGSDPVRIGVQVYAGTDYFNYNGDIAEIIIYDSALSDTDRSSVESYLMSKWGIA